MNYKIYQHLCATCEKPFEGKRTRRYCSHQCYAKDRKGKPISQYRIYICRGCGNTFQKSPGNLNVSYCTHPCYLKHRPKIRKERVKCYCQNCGDMFEKIPSVARVRRFCSGVCWRKYYAERFDRWVKENFSTKCMQNFDEYLTQNALSCLVEGCDWEGQHLGMHVNHAHGITAEQFKKLVGFNRGTALITPDLAKTLSIIQGSRDHSHLFQSAPDITQIKPKGEYKRRKEAKEHQSKIITERWSQGIYKGRAKKRSEHGESQKTSGEEPSQEETQETPGAWPIR